MTASTLLPTVWAPTMFAVSLRKGLKLLKGPEDPSQVCLKEHDDTPIPGITLDVFLAHISELVRELHDILFHVYSNPFRLSLVFLFYYLFVLDNPWHV